MIAVLAQTSRPRKYWDDLKRRLILEGSELSEKIGQLKMQASDGKFYLTDVADTEVVLRIIQSVPSPKTEPFKCCKDSFSLLKLRSNGKSHQN